MRRKATLFGAGVMAAGSLFVAAPAQAAAPVCAGTQNTIVLCVDPVGRTWYEDCVYLGSSWCVVVTVPGPTIQCGGDIGERLCVADDQG